MFLSAINKLKLFDVTMTNCSKFYNLTLSNKVKAVGQILYEHTPDSIELGGLPSLVNVGYANANNRIINNRVVCDNKYSITDNKHSLNDTVNLYNYVKQFSFKHKINCKPFILLPLKPIILNQAREIQVENISLVTSLSNTFLKRFTSNNLENTKSILSANIPVSHFSNVKLYITCLSSCDFEGIQNTNKIVNEILYYNSIRGITELCLSDTYGELGFKEFKEIIDALANKMDVNKLSIRLCIKKQYTVQDSVLKRQNIENIIQYCIENKIYKFDVVNDMNNYVLSYGKLYELVDDRAVLAYYC
jgi:hypothetical protein